MQIKQMSGNQYIITMNDGEKHKIDMDGTDIVSADDYLRLDCAGIDMDGYLTPDDHDGDMAWKAVAKHIEIHPNIINDRLKENLS